MRAHSLRSRRAAGFSLIELMIAMLLGGLVVAAAGGVFISNKRIYNATETLGRLQESTRVAFELMSRDLREAGGNPCSAAAIPVNHLTNGDTAWWDGWVDGIRGYGPLQAVPGLATGGGAGQRVAGTPVVEVHIARDAGLRVTSHNQPGDPIGVTGGGTVAVGDLLMACNMDYAMIFEASSVSATQLGHAAGGLNCGDAFVFQRDCGAAARPGGGAVGYCLMPDDVAVPHPTCLEFNRGPAQIARITTVRWYIGNNDRGGRSLYRTEVVNTTGGNTPNVVLETLEIAEGVTDMQLRFLEGDAYALPAGVADWGVVSAVSVQLDFAGAAGALTEREVQGTDGNAIQRTTTNIVALRNREAVL
jgi:type IV pilus assembly protein PilW